MTSWNPAVWHLFLISALTNPE